MRYSWILAMAGILAGCAHHGPATPGTQLWHDQRMAELSAAYQNHKLTDQQYISLKSEVDAIRVDYQQTYYQDPWTPPSLYPGCCPHRVHQHPHH